MKKDSKIYVAGHAGLVGSNIVKNLIAKGYNDIVVRGRNELDLTNQNSVMNFFETERPEYVFLAAAKVGGINANNTYPANFIMENLQIQCNIIDAAYKNDVKKLLFLGSSCIYPKMCPQPIKEEYLLTGALESTNEAYALAKISGLKTCYFYKKQYGANFVSVMPTNLYGPGDNFDLENSHVLPAILRKMHEAKVANLPTVEIWGTGKALREFLYVEDMADACVFVMENYDEIDFLNIGTGEEISIKELAEAIKEVVGYKGDLCFNIDKPDGTPRKLVDSTRLKEIGWKYQYSLRQGIEKTYKWYLENEDSVRTH
ncbi:GDP-L-fucose synthase family protein [Clostridium beijerinckii]|uniref:GDP-L-fucose synthase n=1 Tax=Clostridium beijerinckii TaxID=1520 RepID=A0A1S8SAN3_CLOBE|nr:GDP-L-fucose synthase [Clostridium beijerinckii]NRY60529.1 GDP-L-fucose synthase [Clostridium beijerinckii]OOM62600.1 GDP-L-fucose synthase [Clostridium beijerinckii]